MSFLQGHGFCYNCMRSGVQITPYDRALVVAKRRRKFYSVDVLLMDRPVYNLCMCCSRYLFNKKNVYREYWPSMVYKFLVDGVMEGSLGKTFKEKWSLLPLQWRDWWKHRFRVELSGLGEIECQFTDVTHDAELLEESISKLEWVDLAKAMDKHMAYPEVRCPFGCSEFLHKVNRAPFEDFLWHYSDYQLDSYCQPTGTVWTDSISPSFPKTAMILERFPCRPSVVIDSDGPQILLCREHSIRSKEAYLHVPESATGNIYTPNANAFAPVAIRPRTNRNFKRNVRSDTFCTVDQVGGYSGVDSSYITSSNILRCDGLSSRRDSLSLQGRPDVKMQAYDRSANKKSPAYVPKDVINQIIDFANKQYPGPLTALDEWMSSTYIDCLKAISLQEKTYDDGSRTIQVYNEDASTGSFQERLFVPPWPTSFVKIHPIDDHGQRFQRVMEKDFGLWSLLCVTACVSDLWETIARSVRDNISWDGHWLRYASIYLRMLGTRRTCKIFKKKKKRKDILSMFRAFSGGRELGEILKDRGLTAAMFSKCSDVLVVGDHLPSDEDLNGQWKDKHIVVCLSPRPSRIGEESGIFELRCLLSCEDEAKRGTYRMHVRHPGKRMWVQNGTEHCIKRISPDPDDQAWRHSTVAVYCRISRPDFEMMKRRYMSQIGGQSHVYCGHHRCPLVLNHLPKSEHTGNYKCICCRAGGQGCCDSYAAYMCPIHSSCRSAICADHIQETKKRCNEKPPDTVFYLSQEGGRYDRLPDDENGCIVDDEVEEMDVDVCPEGLGPTMAHEIPQDILEDQYERGEWSIDEHENGDYQSGGVETGVALNQDDTEILEHAIDRAIYLEADNEDVQDGDSIECNPGVIACTQAGAEQPVVEVEDGVVTSGSVPLYVLLNMQGHLLTRSRSKLRMSKRHRAIFEKLISRSRSGVVPLVYGEAQLFPSIFWQSLPDGTIPGAIPTALWCDAETLKRYGIASMRQHSKQRIMNPASLTSVDPSYHFLQMDVNVNLSLRGKNTRIILNRGFADNQGSDGIKFREKSDAAELYGETSENHANVHKLSALVRERRPHFFFTQSCNQESCGGLRVLREWVTSDEARSHLAKKYDLDRDQADSFLRESAASYILRSWNEVADLWMKYIIYSPEVPLGRIEYAWYRKEFQEKQGNPSHLHAILRTMFDITTPEGLQAVLKKIRGCVADLIHTSEAIEMENKGFVSSAGQLIEILRTAKSYLTHRCHERCQIPKTNRDGETVFICKVHDNYLKTYTPSMHSIQEVPVYHTAEAKAIYNRLGFMDGDVPIHDSLKSERHIPICSTNDPKFSPTNGHLFVCYPSSQNIQFTTGHAIAAYLVKYVAGFDEVAIAVVHAMKKDHGGSVRAVVDSLKNTKITSNKIAAAKKKSKLKNTARILTQMECLTVVLGSNLVTSTEQFINMPTSPREYRSAFFRPSGPAWFERIEDFLDDDVVRSQDVRKIIGLRGHRLFSKYQEDVIKDEQQSPLSVDAITIFSVRPPELRFVNSVRLYLRWFDREPALQPKPKTLEEYESMMKTLLSTDLSLCRWIDGLDMKVTLRRGAIKEIIAYIKNRKLCGPHLFGNSVRSMNRMTQLLEQIDLLYRQFERGEFPRNFRTRTLHTSQRQYNEICGNFLSRDKSEKLPIVWSTPVYPKNKGRFLVSLLLLFGCFETEYELMLQGNMKLAYVHAGLFRPEEARESFDDLMGRYVTEYLSFMPGSIYQKDRNLCFAESALAELLLDELEDVVMETPCVLQSMIEDETHERVKNWRKKHVECFMESLYQSLHGAGFRQSEIPNKAELLKLHFPGEEESEPLHEVQYSFPPLYNEESPQSDESYTEQRAILVNARNTISRYMAGSSHKNIVICGGPGNGKTTVCEEICMYALSRGLSGMVTSIVADRSKTLGGIHIHSLCSIPIIERGNLSPGKTAEAAIATMYRKPELLYLWQKMDFLCIDEFGAVSAEMMATMDIIARHAKESNRFMGGILLICTMDPRQLLPVTGTAVMLSMSMMTEFSFVELKESVRAANDRNLRRLCELSRTIDWTDEDKEEFKVILTENCNFVSSFDDQRIPDDAIFVFGRKSPCKSVEDSVLRRIANSGTRVVRCEASDEESSFAGNWRPASAPASSELSRKVKEKKELFFFEKGRYEFTYNLHGSFQQGQLAILLQFNENDVRQRNVLRFYRGPSGCKEFPPLSEFTPEALVARGWEPVSVPFTCSQAKRIGGGLQARRNQYGVRLRVASTIHACQGATFGALVTAVTKLQTHPDLNFTLWEAAQVIVLISRTRRCSDMYFVGNAERVADQLIAVLSETGRYLRHIQALTRRLCGELDYMPVLMPPPIFRPCDIVLDREPAVYLLVSTRHVGYMYIGETENIRKRLNQHNSGMGSKFTNNSRLRPWALFGFVAGIGSRKQRHLFEQTWKHRAMEDRNRGRRRRPTGVLQLAIDLAFAKNRTRDKDSKLVVRQCGEMTTTQQQQYVLVEST